MRFKRNIPYEYGLRQFAFVPFVNILFLLLFFLLVIAAFINLPGLSISLPGIVSSATVRKQIVELVIKKESLLYYHGKKISKQDLEHLFSSLPVERISVFIKADASVALSDVTDVWGLCRKAGIANVNIVLSRE